MADSQPKTSFLKGGKYWPWIIAGMLVIHASIILGTILIVNSRGDLYVDPDYYAKSVDWDNQRELNETAENMGWSLDVQSQLDEHAQGSNARSLELTFTDRNNDPIDGASIIAQVYHPSHANDRTEIVLVGEGEGLYRRPIDMNNNGFWIIELSIRYQGIQALVSKEIEITQEG